MGVWVWSAQMAGMLGTVLFVVLFAPIVIWQYRHYGRLSFPRVLGAAAVSLYFVALATYTWLPLPANDYCIAHPGHARQTVPLNFLTDIRHETAGMTWRQRLTSFPVLQAGFNIALFVPLGILVRRFFHRSLVTTVLIGFVVSSFIELTQFTGLWFVYTCSYRLADVDDIILNTAGALIGGIAAPLFLWWMPSAESLSAGRLEPRPLTVWRRWLGMFVDAVLLLLGQSILQIMSLAALSILGYSVTTDTTHLVANLTLLASWVFVFLAPSLGRGGSLGQRALWLEPRWPDTTGALGVGKLWQRLARTCTVSLPLVSALLISGDTAWESVIALLCGAVVLLDVVMVPFTKDRGGLSARLSGATFVDSRS